MSQFTGSPVDLSANQPQAPQTSEHEDFMRVAATISAAPTANPEQLNDIDPERFQSVAKAIEAHPPSLLQHINDDPAGASATIDAWIRKNIQGDTEVDTVQGAQAVTDAYKSIYGQRPMTAEGGKSVMQDLMRQRAAGKGEFTNTVAGFSQSFANAGLSVVGIVAPETANNLRQTAQETYNPDTTRFSGQAGEFTGTTLATLPAMLVPGAAAPAFAAMGVGQARQDIAERRANGQEISGGKEAAYAATTGVIQGVMAHYLGQIMNGRPGQVPLQNLIRQISPGLLDSIRGTDGAVLRPLIQRTLLNAGVGAGQNEIAMVAQEIAKSAMIATSNDPDILTRIQEQSPGVLAGGAVQGAGFGLIGEAKEPGRFGKEGEHVTPEPVQPQLQAPDVLPPVSPVSPATVAPAKPKNVTEESSFFEDHTMFSSPEEKQAMLDYISDPGRALPVADLPAQNEEIKQYLEDAKKAIAESDELLQRTDSHVAQAPIGDHPLVEAAREAGHEVTQVRMPDELIPQIAEFEKARNVSVVPVSSKELSGYSHPEHPDAVLFNVNDPSASFKQIIGHEWGHTFMDQFGGEAKVFLDKLPAARKAEVLKEYAKRYGKGADEYLAKHGEQEVFASILGKAIESDASSWNKLLRREPTLWAKIKEIGSKILNSFTGSGRELNAVRELLAKNMDITLTGDTSVKTKTPEEFYGGRETPASYLSIGHRFRDDGSEHLWWLDEDSRIKTEEVTQVKGTHIQQFDPESGGTAADSAFRGRIDNTLKEISLVAHPDAVNDPMTERRMGAMARRLESKYPGYTVFVSGRGGLVPSSELAAGRLYPTLDKVKEIKEDQPIGEKAKELYNKATPKNGWTFAKAVGDTLRKGLSDSLADFVDVARAIDKTKPIEQVPLEAYIRLHGGLAERLGNMRQRGLRKLFGDAYVDPKTEQAMDRKWQLDPVKTAVERLGDKASRAAKRKEAYDFTNFSTRLGVAESTIERGENAVQRETVTSMRDKIKSILSSLPGGETLVKRVMTENAPLAETGQSPERTLRQEIKAVKDMVKSAKQSLSDMLAMNKGVELKDRPESGAPDLNERLAKAKKQLEVLNEFMNKANLEGHEKSGELKLNDLTGVFTDKEAEAIIARADKGGIDAADALTDAADRRIDTLLDSLPPDTLPKFNKKEPAEETRTPEEIEADDAAEAGDAELKRINAAKRDIKKRLADALSMVRAAERGPTNGPPLKKESAPVGERIAKAQVKLDKLDTIMDSVQTGKRVEPNEFFNADELIALKKTALEKPLTGIAGEGANGFRDIETAKAFIENAKTEKNYDIASEFMRRYRLMGTAHLDVLVQSGRLSKDSANKIRNSNEFYTDLHRVMEKTGTIDPGQTAGSGILHKFRGSNREIDNPFINQQMTNERTYQVAERNYILKEFVAQATEHLESKPTLVEKEAGDTISVFEGGEKKIYKVDPMVAEAINGWGKHMTSDGIRLLGKVLGAPGRTWMFLTHKNPFYHVNNIIKDMRSRAILSNESGGLKAIGTEIEGLQDRETRELVEVLGGTFGGRGELATSRAAYERITRKALNELAGDPNVLLALPQKAWGGFKHFTEISESVGRTAEYKAQFEAAKKRGMADQDARTYAAWKARDLMDFAISGTWIKAINEIAYVPVLNSQFRGLAKHIEMVKNQPQQYAKRMALFGMLPALIPAVWAYSQGKEQWKKYQGIPLVQRIMFDNYMIGNQRVVIPRGEMVASASMTAELAFQNHLDVNDVFRALAATQVPGGVENPDSLLPLRGIREAKSNYSWFYNRNIIPPDEEGVALDLRKTDSASPLAKAISMMAQKAGMELDPRKIEHVINTDLGTLGTVANSVTRAAEDKGLSHTKKVEMLGGYNRTLPGYTDQEVQRALQSSERYKDAGPEVAAIKSNLAQATKAPDVDARQVFVDRARAEADRANAFYEKYSDKLLIVKKLGAEMNAAKTEYDSVPGQQRLAFMKDNPEKAALIRQDKEFDRISTRITELRKVTGKAEVSDSTKAMAARELDRLFGLLMNLAKPQ